MRARGPEGRRARGQKDRKGRRVEGQKGTRTGEPAGRRAGGHEGTRAGGQVGQRVGGHEEKRRCAVPPLAPAIGGETPLASLPLRRRRPHRRHSRRVGSAALFVRRLPYSLSLQSRTSKTSERAPPAHASILSASCSRSLRASSPFARVVHFLPLALAARPVAARARGAPPRRNTPGVRARAASSSAPSRVEGGRGAPGLGACLHLVSEPLALAARLLAARARGAPPRRAAPGVRTRAASSLAPSRTPSEPAVQCPKHIDGGLTQVAGSNYYFWPPVSVFS